MAYNDSNINAEAKKKNKKLHILNCESFTQTHLQSGRPRSSIWPNVKCGFTHCSWVIVLNDGVQKQKNWKSCKWGWRCTQFRILLATRARQYCNTMAATTNNATTRRQRATRVLVSFILISWWLGFFCLFLLGCIWFGRLIISKNTRALLITDICHWLSDSCHHNIKVKREKEKCEFQMKRVLPGKWMRTGTLTSPFWYTRML